jgi:mannose-1-phosphate guanylyltransferase/mannose-6-phosphate isomerase
MPSTVKVITVRPSEALSLQYHNGRDELWVALDPGAQVEVGDQSLNLEPEEMVLIPRRTPHRLSAIGEEPVRILEISLGEFDEYDIVRLEDVYGRVESKQLETLGKITRGNVSKMVRAPWPSAYRRAAA